jgi:membrane-bound lytic murein transglycosylase A
MRAAMPRTLAVALAAFLAITILPGCALRGGKKKDYARQLGAGEIALRKVDIGAIPPITTTPQSRAELRRAIAHSLAYLAAPSARARYATGIAGVSITEVESGLRTMDELLQQYPEDAALDREFRARFEAYSSVGWDDEGTVLFTGYFTPIYDASPVQTDRFRYPVYKRPADLGPNSDPGVAQTTPVRSTVTGELFPDAATLESSGRLKGTELVFFDDPWKAYVVRVQGSAKIRMPDGSIRDIGYDGTNGHPYVSVGKELVKDGKIPADQISMPTLMAYFKNHPEDVPAYIRRNPRMVFFRFTEGGPFGSIGKPVTADVTIATDKAIFPPGALTFVDTKVHANSRPTPYASLRVDQDTGGAIRAPGRCDLYMGVGEGAEVRAGDQYYEGKLYYLIAK